MKKQNGFPRQRFTLRPDGSFRQTTNPVPLPTAFKRLPPHVSCMNRQAQELVRWKRQPLERLWHGMAEALSIKPSTLASGRDLQAFISGAAASTLLIHDQRSETHF